MSEDTTVVNRMKEWLGMEVKTQLMWGQETVSSFWQAQPLNDLNIGEENIKCGELLGWWASVAQYIQGNESLTQR